jgi:hypothetical protein
VPQNDFKTLWHYAPWAYLPKMVSGGVLQPSNAGAPTELPLLWFSRNQRWEPTATKLVGDSHGNLLKISFLQQAQMFGCIRFGIAAGDDRLVGWEEACSTRGVSNRHKVSLEAAGRALVATPQDWFASRTAIPLPQLDLQVWVGRWLPAESAAEMARVWEEHREEAVA